MRFRIYREIATRDEVSCRELVEIIPISQPTISHHLKVLSQAGLLAVRRSGSFHHYSARREILEEHLRLLADLGPAPQHARPGETP